MKRDLAGQAAGLRGISGADWLLYGAVAAVSLGIGIVNALSAAQDAAWRGAVYDARTPLFWEMTSIVTIIVVAPVLFVAVRRMRHVSGWPLRIGLAVAAIIVFSSLAHRRHGWPSQTRDVPCRRYLRFSLLGRDADLRIPQGCDHLPLDRRRAVADRQPPRSAAVPPGRDATASARGPAICGAPHGLAPRRVDPRSASNPAISSGSVRPAITSNTALLDGRQSPGPRNAWPPRKRG